MNNLPPHSSSASSSSISKPSSNNPSTTSNHPCDDELIHLPGAIQSFGALLAVEHHSYKIIYVSKNSKRFFGFTPHELLDKNLTDVFGAAVALQLKQGRDRLFSENWIAAVVKHSEYFLIEAELRDPTADLTRIERSALSAIQNSLDLAELLKLVTEEISALTQLDRVMIYRFHNDLHGEVVAETVRPGVDSYFGLHYPSGDIPLPARNVFLAKLGQDDS